MASKILFWFLTVLLLIPNISIAQEAVPVSQLSYMSTGSGSGWEERGPEFRRWLAPSVRLWRFVDMGFRSGSGTVVYYDKTHNYLYVISCGHLFERGKFRLSPNQRPTTINVEVFFQNIKLNKPKTYRADVLCYVFDNAADVSLLRFQPDWSNPYFAPIAPLNQSLIKGQWYHSCGCDKRTEVAHYLVQFVQERYNGNVTEYVTQNNSPRKGRSGGGVFTDDGLLIAICSRGYDNSGVGLWTSLRQIHGFLQENGYQFILNAYSPLQNVRIIDGKQGHYTKAYVPMPQLYEPSLGIKVPSN